MPPHRQRQEMIAPQLTQFGLQDSVLPSRLEDAGPLRDRDEVLGLFLKPSQRIGPAATRRLLSGRVLVVLGLNPDDRSRAARITEADRDIECRPVIGVPGSRRPGDHSKTRSLTSAPRPPTPNSSASLALAATASGKDASPNRLNAIGIEAVFEAPAATIGSDRHRSRATVLERRIELPAPSSGADAPLRKATLAQGHGQEVDETHEERPRIGPVQ